MNKLNGNGVNRITRWFQIVVRDEMDIQIVSPIPSFLSLSYCLQSLLSIHVVTVSLPSSRPSRLLSINEVDERRNRHSSLLFPSMIYLLLLILPLIVSSQSNRCWSSGNGGSARWWNEGERIDRGTV